jgi:hypothetical protein
VAFGQEGLMKLSISTRVGALRSGGGARGRAQPPATFWHPAGCG